MPPAWFTEGLAQIAGAQVDPNFDSSDQQTLKRLFANNALLPVETLSDYDSWGKQTEIGIAMGKGDDAAFAPDPYAQGYGMTKYLLDNITTAQLQSFLNRNRESRDFYGAFKDEFGMTTEQFYELWKRDTAQKLAAQ